MNTLLVIAEYLVAIGAAYALVRYVVLPAIRKDDSAATPSNPAPPPKSDGVQP
jgi:hypothetical protein